MDKILVNVFGGVSQPTIREETQEEHFDHIKTYLTTLGISKDNQYDGRASWAEEIRTTPLFTWPVKHFAKFGAFADGTQPPMSLPDAPDTENSDWSRRGNAAGGPRTNKHGTTDDPTKVELKQYSVYGHELASRHREPRSVESSAVFLNVNAPWSAFLCGSQGSGKSYTLSCMLENALLTSPRLGRNDQPLAGICFQYDNHASQTPAEAAYLASHVGVTVLVSPSNFLRMNKLYGDLPGVGQKIKVFPLLLLESHLNTERMLRLMAFNGKDEPGPLYMEVVRGILKEMAMEDSALDGFKFKKFTERLRDQKFNKGQQVPMTMRLELLKGFMNPKSEQLKRFKAREDVFRAKPGTLTIVDLTDPFIDADSACVLFDICLALFTEHKQHGVGKVIALDEAHKFMDRSAAAEIFTDSLLTLVREQRHKGARIIVATQDPTISPALLDLCTITIVHRFTSPEWLATLKKHLAGVSMDPGGEERDVKEVFRQIVDLHIGESLLFSPSAMLDVVDGEITKLGLGHVKFMTRPRLTADGGRSVLVSR